MTGTSNLSSHPYANLLSDLDGKGKYFSLQKLSDTRIARLPYCVKILLESTIRNCNNISVHPDDVERLLNWKQLMAKASNGDDTPSEIAFKPSRVLLQDFTGVPALVDLAHLRDQLKRLGGNPEKINPFVPVDLVIDHSVQVDYSRMSNAREKNEALEFQRNKDRFGFLKWGANSFKNLRIFPPGSGIVHQVNLEYLATLVATRDGLLFPDSLVGTDSHTTMIGGLGVIGWGVGGIEAEAVMLDQPISMSLPEVIGFRLTNQLDTICTATDLVLTITEILRKVNVVGKFVEFFGSGCKTLSLADRATISNMSPEFGATLAYFPVDQQSLQYMQDSGRKPELVNLVKKYYEAQGLFCTNSDDATHDYCGEILHLDLATVKPCIAGPKRPQDRVSVDMVSSHFTKILTEPVGLKGFGLTGPYSRQETSFEYQGQNYRLGHGSIVIAAITSCTNTSNPEVMVGAGLLARNAVKAGLEVMPYIKTSLSPGSSVVSKYLAASGLMESLQKLNFYETGLGCQTCIGNSGDLDKEVAEAVGDLVVASVLSGNRNFEGRVHPLTRANFLASPMLVIAYALAGTVVIDFEHEALGFGSDGQAVYLKDLWPSKEEIRLLVKTHLAPSIFEKSYSDIQNSGSEEWQKLDAESSLLYPWRTTCTYIDEPPFTKNCKIAPEPVKPIVGAYCLLNLPDSTTTDHISPAGKIALHSPAGCYLTTRGVSPHEFNSYGARRGNVEIMKRGTFGNTRLVNKLVSTVGPTTIHHPSKTEMPIFDAAMRYRDETKAPLIVLAGKEYGSGSSRDWAAKGPFLLGVKAVIAVSFERIHRSNLVGMGILPLTFVNGESAESLGLTGTEQFTIALTNDTLSKPRTIIIVEAKSESGETKKFNTNSGLYTQIEVQYFQNNGILPYVLRQVLQKN